MGAAPRPASGTWVKPAPVAGTVEGGMSGATGGAVVGGGGSVAAVIAPADMEFAPAAAGAPVDIPFVKDCARDCGDKGGADAAGVETPGIDGPPTPTAGAPGWRGGGASGGGVLPGGKGFCSPWGPPYGDAGSEPDGVSPPDVPDGVNGPPYASAGGGSTGVSVPDVAPGVRGPPYANAGGEGSLTFSAENGRDGGGSSRFTSCACSHVRALPPIVASSTL